MPGASLNKLFSEFPKTKYKFNSAFSLAGRKADEKNRKSPYAVVKVTYGLLDFIQMKGISCIS